MGRAGRLVLGDIAAAANTKASTISRYLTMPKKRPDGSIVDAMAAFLGVEGRWLGLGRGPMLSDGTEGPDYIGSETLDETLKIFPIRWNPKTVSMARDTPRYREETLGTVRREQWIKSWRETLDSIRETHGHQGYFQVGRPKGTRTIVNPIDDELRSYEKRVRHIGAAWGASPAQVDHVLAQAAKGGVSKLTDREIEQMFAETNIASAKRVPDRKTAAEKAAEVDDLEGTSKRSRGNGGRKKT